MSYEEEEFERINNMSDRAMLLEILKTVSKKDEIAKLKELLEDAEWLLVEQFMEAEKTELSSKITSYLYQNEAAK